MQKKRELPVSFVNYAKEKGTSCVMCHEENRLDALQKTAVITVDQDWLITSYEEKPVTPKGNLAVPPFYYYRRYGKQCFRPPFGRDPAGP